jgi:hypothetical protein
VAWIVLTADELLRSLTGPEKAAVSTAALAAGQTDPVPAIVEDVINEVRGYIAAHPSNALGLSGTIPEKLKIATLSRARYEALTRLPIGRSILTEDRVKSNESARTLLRDVAAGRFQIEEPTEVHPTESGGPGVRLVRNPSTSTHPFAGIGAT